MPLLIIFIFLFSVKVDALDYPVNSTRSTLSSDALASWFYSNSGSSNYSFVSDPTYIGNWGKGTPSFVNTYSVDFTNLCNVMLDLNNHGYTCKIYVDSNRRAYIQSTNNVIWKNQADAQVSVTLGFLTVGRDLTVPIGYYFTQASYNCYYCTQDLKLIYCDLSSEYETILTNIYNTLGTISSSVTSVYNYVVLQYSRLGTIETYIDSVESQLSSVISNTSASGPIVQAINNMSTNIVNVINQKNLSVNLGNVSVDASSISLDYTDIIRYLEQISNANSLGFYPADYFCKRIGMTKTEAWGRWYYTGGSGTYQFHVYTNDLYFIEYTNNGASYSYMIKDLATGQYLNQSYYYESPPSAYIKVYKLLYNHDYLISADSYYHSPIFCGPVWALPSEYADLIQSDYSYLRYIKSIDSHLASISIPNYSSKLDSIDSHIVSLIGKFDDYVESVGDGINYNNTDELTNTDRQNRKESKNHFANIFGSIKNFISGYFSIFTDNWDYVGDMFDDNGYFDIPVTEGESA